MVEVIVELADHDAVAVRVQLPASAFSSASSYLLVHTGSRSKEPDFVAVGGFWAGHLGGRSPNRTKSSARRGRLGVRPEPPPVGQRAEPGLPAHPGP